MMGLAAISGSITQVDNLCEQGIHDLVNDGSGRQMFRGLTRYAVCRCRICGQEQEKELSEYELEESPAFS